MGFLCASSLWVTHRISSWEPNRAKLLRAPHELAYMGLTWVYGQAHCGLPTKFPLGGLKGQNSYGLWFSILFYMVSFVDISDKHVLLCKRCTEQSYKSQRRPTHSRLPTAKVVCEHADHRWTEEDHAHGQGPNPGWRGSWEKKEFIIGSMWKSQVLYLSPKVNKTQCYICLYTKITVCAVLDH